MDVKNMMIYFHTNINRKLRYFSLSNFDFSNDSPSRVLDIHADLSDDVSDDFFDYSYESNYKLTKERADILFIERLKGLEGNGITAEIYAKRFADYSKRMRSVKTDDQRK